MKIRIDYRQGSRLLAAALLLLVSACTYQERVAPIALPETSGNMVTVGDGLKISARAFTDEKAAKESFGFDARKAGLLPVQVTFENDSSQPVTVNPSQTFLIDNNRNAWPILSRSQAYDRAKGYVEVGQTLKGAAKPSLLAGAAGAVAGLAVGIVTGHDVGEAVGKGAAIGAAGGALAGGASSYANAGDQIKENLATMSLKEESIQPKQIAYGVLFFPGAPKDEAAGASELRLALTYGKTPQVVRINLAGQ
ncbi:MAG: hypothetical protein M0017_11080 [Desulfobacteraceae bacterium]|nr:hypothetical protein [Desulfobacteraceae bacterium]